MRNEEREMRKGANVPTEKAGLTFACILNFAAFFYTVQSFGKNFGYHAF
jgi:hypothetical protein